MLPAFFVFFPKAPEHKIVRVQPKSLYYDVIPKRAVALANLTTYKNANLTEKSATLPRQTQLAIKTIVGKAFELTNGTYVSASTKLIGSDVTLTEENSSIKVFTRQTVNVLYSPFTTYDSKVYSNLAAGQTLQTLKKVSTHWGTYYEISFAGGRTGWVSSASVSLEDPKMIALQQTLNQKYNNKEYSITVKELDSKFTVGVNQNEELYAASLWKLSVLYWVQKQLNEGNAALSDGLKYIPEVNNSSWGAFNPAGTGTLPKVADNQTYNLLDVINLTAKESDNVGSNLLGYYECGQFNQAFQKQINKIAGRPWDPTARNASSLMVANVLEALYSEGGACYNALIGTSYDDQKIAAGVPSGVVVAHKIGDADAYNHDAAIVWAGNPYILVVMTNGGSDTDITQISQTVYEALK